MDLSEMDQNKFSSCFAHVSLSNRFLTIQIPILYKYRLLTIQILYKTVQISPYICARFRVVGGVF